MWALTRKSTPNQMPLQFRRPTLRPQVNQNQPQLKPISLTSITTKNWESQKMKFPLCWPNLMKVQLPSSRKTSSIEPWIFCKKLTASWMLSISPFVAETNITYSWCSTTWLYVTKRCKCSRNVPSVSNMPSSTCPSACSISKRKAFPTVWERFSSSVSSSFSTAPSCHRSTSTRKLSNRPEKVWKCAITWSTTCTNFVSFTFREKRSITHTRTKWREENPSKHKTKTNRPSMNIAAGSKRRETMALQAGIDHLAVSLASKKLITDLKVLTWTTSKLR